MAAVPEGYVSEAHAQKDELDHLLGEASFTLQPNSQPRGS